jgi:exosortase
MLDRSDDEWEGRMIRGNCSIFKRAPAAIFSWRFAAAIVLTSLAVAVAWGAWRDMIRTGWNDEESSHVLLVPIVVAWLVWLRRARFSNWHFRRPWVGTILIAIGWLSCSVGYRYNRYMCWEAGAIVMAVGAVTTVAGTEALTRFRPAAAALIFLIPLFPRRRYLIARPLGAVTARVTQVVCELFRMHVERHGNLLIVNGVNVSIAEACNGMRMVITLLLVSYVYCFVMPLRWPVRVLLLVASPITAMLCNIIRLVPTVWMFGNASSQLAQTFHDLSGWLMVGVAFLWLMGIVRLLERLTGGKVAPLPRVEWAM